MNLRSVDTNELKQIQLSILDVVADFCGKNNINYWLDFGTLIGAVRHKGYIPWDDDIDICMLRSDYDKFMRNFNDNGERYKFYSYENDKNFYYPFGKVLDTQTVLYEPDKSGVKLCVNIDIFVYDNVPNDERVVKKMLKVRDRNCLCETAYKHRGTAKGSVVRKLSVFLLKMFVRLFPRDYFIKKIVKNAKKYLNTDTGFVGDFTGNTSHFICEKALLSEFTDAEFEGRIYKIPVGYDKLLRLMYGDYMQLPPEAERVSHHKFEAYAIED